MNCYWDTSALLPLLIPEAGTIQVRRAAEREGGLPGYTSFFTLLELESAYARRLAEGVLTESSLARLRLKARELESALALIWPDEDVLEEARRLIPALGLRPADSLQLASAKLAARARPEVRFVSLDERLNAAARAEGLSLAL